MARSCSADLSNKLSLCHRCHPADGAFDPRDALVNTLFPNVLAEVSKKVEKSKIASQSQASVVGTIDYIICLLLARHYMLVDWVAATKFKLILGALSNFPRKLVPPKITRYVVCGIQHCIFVPWLVVLSLLPYSYCRTSRSIHWSHSSGHSYHCYGWPAHLSLLGQVRAIRNMHMCDCV